MMSLVLHCILFISINKDPAEFDPQQNQSVVEGKRFITTATVKTHGSPRETYTWLYSKTGTGTKTVLGNSLLHTIQNISRSEAGYYTIEATNLIHPTGLKPYNKTVSQTIYLDVFCKYLELSTHSEYVYRV